MLGANGSVWSMFHIYGGNCLILLAYFVSLIFLFFREKNKSVKAVLVYLSLAILGLFFFPPFAKLWMFKLGEEPTYYRFLWMLPEAIVCGYALIRFMELLKWTWLKIAAFTVAVVCIMIGGNPVYNSPVFTKAENIYQVPECVVEICDEIVVPGREVKAVFPNEILQYVRQYTALVVLPYGYETLVDRWGFQNEIFDEMNLEVSDAKRLSELCRANECHFIILNRNHLVNGSLEDYDYMYLMESGDYLVYKDIHADISVPDSPINR
ncbi:MAG: hypothetical protein PUE21_06140 [Lachnospiraceae bacterium]|nr:hypothetical protein [Lachnospiraceae bacterium]